MGLEGLKTGNFAVDYEIKIAAQKRAREVTIPELVDREATTEEALLALHYSATDGVQEVVPSRFARYKAVLETTTRTRGFGMTEKLLTKMVWQIIEERLPNVRIDLAPDSARGRYRLQGTVEVEGHGTVRRDVWEPRSIQIITPFGEGAYETPHQRVDRLMGSLCRVYEELEERGNDPLDIALRLAYFYSIGNRLIHPFVDGNHRAFDRFLEYGFAKAGIPLDLPQDSTGNIPVSEKRFKTSTANFMQNLFMRSNLLPLISPSLSQREVYQNVLLKVIYQAIAGRLNDDHHLYNYLGVAGELLKWAGLSQEDRIKELQEAVALRGGFRVEYH